MAVAFENEAGVICFLFVAWLFEKLVAMAKGSVLIGNLIAGIILGPALLNIVPNSDSWRLIGKIGVLILVVDGSLQIDLEKVKQLGARALAAAAMGVIGPVCLSMAICMGAFDRPWKSALATGAALAPTSLGFSAKLLSEFNAMDTDMGQLICTAAVMDDVISLMLLAEIQAMEGDPSAWDYAQPIVASVGSVIVGMILALFIFPKLLPIVFGLFPKDESKQQMRRWMVLILLIAVSTLIAFLCGFAGSSDLLGTFCGAMPFSAFPEVVEAWGRYSKQIVNWGGRLFFAATVGFGVPEVKAGEGNMLDGEAFGKGVILFLVAVIGKSFLAPFALPLTGMEAAKFSFAMQGRGEFSFLIADAAAEDEIYAGADFGSVVWGLLLTCILTPYGFVYVLSKEAAAKGPQEPAKEEPTSEVPEPEKVGTDAN